MDKNDLQEKMEQLEQQKEQLDAREAVINEKEQAARNRKTNIYEKVNVPIRVLDKMIIGLILVMCIVLVAAVTLSR